METADKIIIYGKLMYAGISFDGTTIVLEIAKDNPESSFYVVKGLNAMHLNRDVKIVILPKQEKDEYYTTESI